jgi:hypothetical protein
MVMTDYVIYHERTSPGLHAPAPTDNPLLCFRVAVSLSPSKAVSYIKVESDWSSEDELRVLLRELTTCY